MYLSKVWKRVATKRQRKNQLYGLYAEIGKALSNPGRLELLDLLSQAPRTVEELVAETQMGFANTSQHLQRLKQTRLVQAEREGNFVRYSLADPDVARLWHMLRLVAENNSADVQQALNAFRDRRHEFEVVTAEELVRRLREGTAILIDARPAPEYDAGHLPGALSIPPDTLVDALASLPRDRQIVAYCRGPHCVLADDALAVLSERGYRVARLEEGPIEWQLSGREVQYAT
jgi:rhodanese-related sulfurtransferase/DNA-binding transcriptional ArsR family regulator